MTKSRDYNLVVDGRYNHRAIMQLALVYSRRNKSLRWYSFGHALKDAWADAHLKMDEYQSSLVQDEPIGKQRNVHEFGYAMLGWRYEHVG
ncbi:hypothetical protein POZ03_07690 [Bacteroides uniformis]|uniref:hypothetical protein n=1 Tax=Bacteroides uniformis TaxID=820 RepID=UPI00233E7E0D|nr:hypothetical protein [Bacteroides uniformis]MDC1810339.1 hypothetical protein [Bacteroides uniformis]